MLSAFDDYPVHQTSSPVAHTASSDLNHYDRYFFNGYTSDAGLFFALAMGLYPNRHVADASFSVVVDGARQISVHASRRAPADRRDANEVGPVRVTVVEPLRVLQVHVDAPEHGLRAELTFHARSAAVEEPHFLLRAGARVSFDYTRLTQFGSWQGWVEVDGTRHDLRAATTWGARDRSWGIRPVGERGSTGAPVADPQFFWLWAPINFPTFSTHLDVNEMADGLRWHESGFVVPVGDAAAREAAVDYDISWAPGTRRAAGFSATLTERDGSTARIEMEPLYHFQMLGLGYLHPEWGHGVWKGELAVAGERWDLPVDDPNLPHHLHVQTLCRARCGDQEGLGVLEQLAIGPHLPTGLTGWLDGFGTGS